MCVFLYMHVCALYLLYIEVCVWACMRVYVCGGEGQSVTLELSKVNNGGNGKNWSAGGMELWKSSQNILHNSDTSRG